MPALNALIKTIHSLIENHIVDLPEVTDKRKNEIAVKVADYIKELVVEAVSESVARAVEKQITE